MLLLFFACNGYLTFKLPLDASFLYRFSSYPSPGLKVIAGGRQRAMSYFVASLFRCPCGGLGALNVCFIARHFASTDSSANLSCTGQCVRLYDRRVELRVVGQSTLPPQIPSCESRSPGFISGLLPSRWTESRWPRVCEKLPVRYLGRETRLSWKRRRHVRPIRRQVSIKTECVASQKTASILFWFNFTYPPSLL